MANTVDSAQFLYWASYKRSRSHIFVRVHIFSTSCWLLTFHLIAGVGKCHPILESVPSAYMSWMRMLVCAAETVFNICWAFVVLMFTLHLFFLSAAVHHFLVLPVFLLGSDHSGVTDFSFLPLFIINLERELIDNFGNILLSLPVCGILHVKLCLNSLLHASQILCYLMFRKQSRDGNWGQKSRGR